MGRMKGIFFRGVVVASCLFANRAEAGKLVPQTLDYTDGLQTLENPGRGFYRTRVFHLKESGNKATNTWGSLVHLRIDISAFSDQANIGTKDAPEYGRNIPLTEDALTAIDGTLKEIKKRGATAIVRVCYDKNYEGQTKCEPMEQEVIEGHLRQLAEVWNENDDVIQFVELGMYGPWGEMHSSNIGTNENIASAMQALLESTKPSIKVGVRRPDIIARWMGLAKKEFVVGEAKFDSAAAAKGDTMLRAGMYNDGYLGSSSDLGTIDGSLTRAMMIDWLSEYSAHTPYGGELVANNNGDNHINTPSYLSREGFRTHTSYLNYEWHQPTILGWKDSTFVCEDKRNMDYEYNGASGYDYVENHLGYRFVLRYSQVVDSVAAGDSLSMELDIQNMGFGNVCDEKAATIVIENTESGDAVELRTTERLDARDILCRGAYDNNIMYSARLTCLLPDTLKVGEYNVYLRISKEGDMQRDNNYQCIAFGNTEEQYNAEYGANMVGRCVVTKKDNAGIGSVRSEGAMDGARWRRGARKILRGGEIIIQKGEREYGVLGK